MAVDGVHSTGDPVVEPAPWVGNVKPFLIPSAAALRSDGPNALTSAAYAEDFNEVKRLGSLTSTVRTPDQTDAALFWQANGAGLFNAIFRQLADTQDLDIAEAARMFAMTNMAGADGAIGCWNDKYYWNFWRPITAIREADDDGNPATVADPTWTPLFATPPFPEHPSGHTCISGAVVETLQDFFGTDKIAFGTFSSFSNSTRSFERFSRRSRRSSTPGSGPASTSAPPTCREPCWVRRSPAICGSTTSSRRAEAKEEQRASRSRRAAGVGRGVWERPRRHVFLGACSRSPSHRAAQKRRRARDTAWAMSEENVEAIALGGASG